MLSRSVPRRPTKKSSNGQLARTAKHHRFVEAWDRSSFSETCLFWTDSIYNWENGVSTPDFRKLPAIIAFLGYNPVPKPPGAAERLVWQRRSMGLSQKEAGVAGRGPVCAGLL